MKHFFHMPELPEVETIRRDLAPLISGVKIDGVNVKKKRLVRQPSTKFVQSLKGNTIKKLDRIGKLIVAELESGEYLLVHLKMTGQLIYADKGNVVAGGHSYQSDKREYPNAYTYIIIRFVTGAELYFNDMRQFGYMEIVSHKRKQEIYNNYGIEPLQSDFTWEHFIKALGKRKTMIKAALLNQQLFAGVGNIYADEICFAAGVRPMRKVYTLTLAEKKEVYVACEKILKKAIKARGTTFNDYTDAHGRRGDFTRHLQVFGRTGEQCKRCKKGSIKKTKVAGRGTHYCSICQK